jgi:hypothetical protein
VLECLGRSLACGRVGDDGDVMAMRLVRPALRLLPEQVVCMAASYFLPRDVEIHSSTRVSGDARAVRLDLHTSRSRTCRARGRLLVRGEDLLCEAETCRARLRLVVRG